MLQLLSEISSGAESPNQVAETFRLLFVGRLAIQKGAEVAIRAMAIAAAENAHLILELAGDGPQRQSLEALSRELGLEDIVIFQ